MRFNVSTRLVGNLLLRSLPTHLSFLLSLLMMVNHRFLAHPQLSKTLFGIRTMGPLTIWHMTKLFLLITKHIKVMQMSGLSAGMTISHIGFASCVSPIINIVLSLQNLLHVPMINKNLLSVSKFSHDNNFFFEFYPDSCSVSMHL